LTQYETNFIEFKNSTKEFKSSEFMQKLYKNDNGERMIRLKDIKFYGKNSDDMDKLLELKTETFKSTCQVRQINQECLKKKLDFLNNEIKKMSLHYPKFSNTESSIEYLDEIKKTISAQVKTQLETFKELTFVEPHLCFSTVVSQPEIFTNLGDSRLNV